ncbi:inner membrane protein [alpha proteobacterium U9-1i]|nr:inner membrane protein [alpha proteobacterium U9-1i]
MGATGSGGISARRADLDSLRVLALLLLIVYHTLLVFDPGANWRVLSDNAHPWAGYLTAALSPWRMPLVFFIAGCAARFMIERISPLGFIKERAAKLLTAFVFTIIALAPLQNYVRLDNLGDPSIGYFDYLFRLAPGANDFHGLPIPDFAHAWFLPYLFVYSALLALIWGAAPTVLRRIQQLVEHAPIWFTVGALMMWFAFLAHEVEPSHLQTSMLLDDTLAHLKFAPVFFLGALIGKSETFRAMLIAARFELWAAASILLLGDLALKWANVQHDGGIGAFYPAIPVARGLFGGAMMFAVAAFGAWALNHPSRQLSYLSDAILPVYLLHQTVLVVAADAITPLGWPLWAELAVLPTLTLLLPLGIYHFAIRPNAWLRRLFGLKADRPTPLEPVPVAGPKTA